MIELVDVLAGRVDPSSLSPEVRAAVLRDAVQQGMAARIEKLHPDFAGAGLGVRYEAIRQGAFTQRIHRCLRDAGIDHLVMKGAAVAAAAWDDPSARPQSDVDILLLEADVERAARLLHEKGLVHLENLSGLHYHQVALEPMDPAGVLVELHFALRADPLIDVTVEELLSRKIEVACPDGTLPTMSDEDAAVYLAVHAAAHGFSRVAWLEDLRGLGRRRPPDWRAAAELARRWGVAIPTLLAWDEARAQLGAAIPEDAIAALHVSRLRSRLSLLLLRGLASARGPAHKLLDYAYQYSLLDGPRAIAAAVRRGLAIRADHRRRMAGLPSTGKLS